MHTRRIGVEEELLLVDPDTRRLTAASARAISADDADAEVGHELFGHQLETSTPATADAAELLDGLRDGRRAVGEAAAAAGARAVAVATAPLAADADAEFTQDSRYARIRSGFGEIAHQAQVCAMHVHVDVHDDAEGVRAVDGLRPWLPFLLAISANSPYWHGRDTGHASWRSQTWGRFPSAGTTEPYGDVDTYRAVAEQTIAWGGAIDPGMLYFDVRLSERYPTVEVRVADVCTDVEDALLVALLARALVESVVEAPPSTPWRADLLRVAAWRAARSGLSGDLVHPTKACLVPARSVVDAVLERVGPVLERLGDHDRVVAQLERLLTRGTGATRQRQVLEKSGDLIAVVDDLARRTEASWR